MIWFVGYIAASWLIADFLSGVFHWLEDQYVTSDTPWISKSVGVPNERHHAKPTEFLSGGYWLRNKTTIIPCAVAVAVVWYFFGLMSCLPIVMLSQANEVHGWSHQRCCRFVRCLQESEILCSVRQHAQHHVDPFSRRYCAMSGLLNPVLDFAGFWQIMELLMRRLFSLEPKYDTV